MIFVGIDPSLTGTGLVIRKDGAVIVARTYGTKPDKPLCQRVSYIAELVTSSVYHTDLEENACICIEEPVGGGMGGQTTMLLAALAIQLRVRLTDIPKAWYTVKPTLAKAFLGKGNMPKSQVMQQVYIRWGYEAANDNLADAYLLSQIAEEVVARPDSKFSKRVIDGDAKSVWRCV